MADPTSLTIPGATQILGGGQQSFVQKLINLQISLGSPTTNQPGIFASGPGLGTNVVTLSNHRTSVRISNVGGGANYATIHVWGVNQSTMNELSQLGAVYNQVRQNSVIVSAGDAINGIVPIYASGIWLSYADYNQQPEVPLVMTCKGALAESVINVAPTTFSGVSDVATLMAGWAALINKTLENNGVTAKLANPYYGGNTWSKIQSAARDANINAQVDGSVLAIWPKGGSRTVATVPLISPATGMIGYPGAYSPNGYLVVRHLFNPLVRIGGQIKLQSSVLSSILPNQMADVLWTVYQLDLALDSLVPHGEWMGTALCYPSSLAAPPPPAVSST